MDSDFTKKILEIERDEDGSSPGADPVGLHELRVLFETFLPGAAEEEIQEVASIQEDVRLAHAKLEDLLAKKVIDADEYARAINTEAAWSMRRCAKVLGRRRCEKLFGDDALDETSLVVVEHVDRSGAAPKPSSRVSKPSRTGRRQTRVVTAPSYAKKPNAAFMRVVSPSARLAAVVGSRAMTRNDVTKRLWAYIKKNGLQDKKNRRMINADANLKAVFGGKSTVNMFAMTKLVSKHLK